MDGLRHLDDTTALAVDQPASATHPLFVHLLLDTFQ